MDSKATPLNAWGATPGKLALVGVLGGILLVVLYVQFSPSDSRRSTSRTAARPRESARSRASEARTADTATSTPVPTHRKAMNLSRWKTPELATVVQYDPFALPASFPQPRPEGEGDALADGTVVEADSAAEQAALENLRAQMQQRLEQLRHQGVHVIVKRRNEYVAVVGDQEIRVGDQIQGFTVVAIDADGVKVAWERSE